MSAQVVGLAASALVVANEISSGQVKQFTGITKGNAASKQAVINLGLMVGGVIVLAVMAGQSSPWPGVAAAILVGLWALWALHTFGAGQKKPATASTTQGAALA